jgi:hypothetical protein
MSKDIVKFDMSVLNSIDGINHLLGICYKKTGEKFRFSFNGSKGYLDNIEFYCESFNEPTNLNRLDYVLFNQSKKTIEVTISLSETKGIVVKVKDEDKLREEFFKKIKKL